MQLDDYLDLQGFVPAPGFSEYQASMDAANIPVREIFYRQRQNDDGKSHILKYLI